MLYIHLYCMKYLLNVIDSGNSFAKQLSSLLEKYPGVDVKALGLRPGWVKEPLWK